MNIEPAHRMDGYRITQLLFQGHNSTVYRGLRERDATPVVLKIPASSSLSIRENLRFRHEYNLLSSLDLSRVIKVYDLLQYRSGFAIVEEDYGACDLTQRLGGKAAELSVFFPIAIQMAEGLMQLHEHKIIHKDINLSNILINQATGVVKLTDFGLSTLIDGEAQEACNPDLIDGTLAYISPEQTGRMNRPIDFRADLYSLGVCYYAMLTGELPFSADDPMELVHCHIAREPRAPHAFKSTVPEALSQLVMKLLEKKAEDRYQSAYGVLRDLETMEAAFEAGDRLVSVALGSQDISTRFRVAQKLYGRGRESRVLLDAFERAADGRSELLLVAGYSGIGKTSLVNEVHKGLVRQRGRFIAGKHDQFQRDIPFSAFIQAFRRLVNQVVTEREDRLADWRKALLEALGGNARVIADVIPEMEYIVGNLPPVPELGATETQNRFSHSFQHFVGVFARREHPLVVFLDDLQWADAPSLHLMELLCTQVESHHLLMLGAYRDNEVSPSHPLMLALGRLREAGAPMETLVLEPLHPNDLNQLVADTLHQPPEETRELSTLLLQKTGGNPFFVSQLLKELHHRGLCWLPTGSVRWVWDMERIVAVGMTDNVVALMAGKIARMTPQCQQVLTLAACIGNRFSLATLATIQETAEHDTGADLWEAIQEGLVLVSGSEFRFLHDRVQQAAYSLIAPEELGPLHLKIGRLLWHHSTKEQLEDRIFELVAHLNAAMDLVVDPEERLQFSALNLQAGKKAKASTAYEPALHHLVAAEQLLDKERWETCYAHTLEIYRERADVGYLLGHFQQAESDIDEALAHASDRYDQAHIYLQKITQYNQLGKYNELVEVARQALRLFDVELPRAGDSEVLAERFSKLLEDYTQLLGGRPIGEMIEKGDVTDRAEDCIIRLMAVLTDGTYIAVPTLFPHVVMEVVTRSLRHGHNAMSAIGFVWAAVIVVQQFQDYQSAYELGRLGLALNERYANPRIRAQVTFLYAVCVLHWVRPLTEQIEVYKEAYQAGIENGNLVFAGYARTMIPKTVLAATTVDKAIEENDISVAFYANTGSPFLMSERFCGLFLRNLKGDSLTPTSLSTDDLDEHAFLDRWQQPETRFGHGLAYFLNCKLQLLVLFGEHRAAWDFATANAGWMQYIPILYETTVFSFYRALAAATLYGDAPEEERSVLREVLAEAIESFTIWVRHCPENFAWQEQLLRGEDARVQGDLEGALNHYGRAAILARTFGHPQGVALSQERAGRLYRSQGQWLHALAALEDAGFHYFQWGAHGKVRALREEFSELTQRPAPQVAAGRGASNQGTSATSSHLLDLNTVLKASLVLSGEMHLPALLEKLMNIVIENAGAERGYLLLPGDDDWVVVAHANVRDKQAKLERSPLRSSTLLSEAMVRFVLRSRQDLFLDDARLDPIFVEDLHVVRSAVRSVLCMPLSSQNRVSGALYLENNLIPGAFAVERSRVLKMLCAQAAISIENARLYESLAEYSRTLEQQVAERTRELSEANRKLQELSDCDALTGLANRRKFDVVWGLEWKRAARHGLPLAVVLLDVDHFKAYNDDLGHQAGDRCLQEVAEALISSARRAGELVARYGGEEFVVVLPGLGPKEAQEVAENLRQAVESRNMVHPGNSAAPVVTVSAGVASRVPSQDMTAASLVEEADRSLYQAKRLGRNRVFLYVP
ncbi:MAG: diguanylate cyclase [Myxococcales bacterium]